ncbi:hypothetical protein BJF89_01095 [Corynebacterium sp. CNJ-954]|uniref:hypothetical protein n=1 Tax=Corynebacterium sp. CNJ-954 TaxID=1904962 RepID=UPI00095A9FCC|nr:hypothetical protein [Corynebacterium sp. CNJ-954]OLT54858.1 hypothetical protein BJF89_01095 [Corynebacterium sp. CNJ-954]
MTPTTIVLIAVVWAVVGLTVAVWRLRQDVAAWDDDLETESDLRRSLNRRHVELTARVGVLEDARDTTADLDVPRVDDAPDATDTPTTRRTGPCRRTPRGGVQLIICYSSNLSNADYGKVSPPLPLGKGEGNRSKTHPQLSYISFFNILYGGSLRLVRIGNPSGDMRELIT